MNYNEAVNIVKSEIIPFIKPGNSGLSKVHLKLLYSCIKSTRSEFLTHDKKKVHRCLKGFLNENKSN